jgi:hypothetical protein
MKRILYILFVLLGLGVTLEMQAQVDRKEVRRGNRDFKKESWREAEIDYRKALVKDSLSVAANYNLANTLYREGDFEQARKVMETVKDVAPASASAADYFYNLGDAAIACEDWQAAVDAFKESLLRNPGDLDAKENYIYAKKKLEDQQNQQNQDQNQNNDQNQDQDQNQNQDQDQNDDQNKDQNKDQQDQNQNQNNNQNDQQNQDQNQGQQPKISPQAAQQMLQAIQAKEKETQDKVNKQKAEALKSRQKEKNW